MSTRRRIALAALLAALCTPFAISAEAGSMQWCIMLNGKKICHPIPGPLYEWPWKPDPPPDEEILPVDISRILPQLRDLVRGEATHLFVTDSLGQTALVIDMNEGMAFDLNQNVAR